jgi:hypothetical protein
VTVWTGAEKLARTGIQSPDRPARNHWIYRLSYPADKSNPITGLDRPLGFQEVEAPKFQENRHMKVASYI